MTTRILIALAIGTAIGVTALPALLKMAIAALMSLAISTTLIILILWRPVLEGVAEAIATVFTNSITN